MRMSDVHMSSAAQDIFVVLLAICCFAGISRVGEGEAGYSQPRVSITDVRDTDTMRNARW